MDSFEREFRIANGKPVPYKFMGHDSVYDLLVSIPEVVQVMPITGGQHLLLAVPDEKTQHIAKMVGNQRDNVDGFNRRTAEVVARVGRDVKMKIEEATGFKDKQVSNFVKKQFVELLEADENLDGILLINLPTVYYKEFGYSIDFDEFGFQSLEEFCFHGLSDSVDMDLDNFQWKIVEKGMLGNTMSINKIKEIPERVLHNIHKLVQSFPNGVAEEEFKERYAAWFKQPLNFRDYSFNSLLELVSSIPGCVRVSQSPSGAIFLPAAEVTSKGSGITSGGSSVVAEVSRNIQQLLEDHSEGVPLATFLRGYQGYHGDLQASVARAGLDNITQLLAQCGEVCSLTTSQAGVTTIAPVSAAAVSSAGAELRAQLVSSLHRVVASCQDGRLPLAQLPRRYLRTTGHNLDTVQLGFSSLKLLIQSLLEESRDMELADGVLSTTRGVVESQECAEATITSEKLESGWVRIVGSSAPDQLTVQLETTRRQLRQLEADMDTFYTWDACGTRVEAGRVRAGDTVAALYTDLAWHRACVVSLDQDTAELHYPDWGWRARVRLDTVSSSSPPVCDVLINTNLLVADGAGPEVPPPAVPGYQRPVRGAGGGGGRGLGRRGAGGAGQGPRHPGGGGRGGAHRGGALHADRGGAGAGTLSGQVTAEGRYG